MAALANVAQMLEQTVKRQEALMERQESRARNEGDADGGSQKQEWTGEDRIFLKRGTRFGKTDGPQ